MIRRIPQKEEVVMADFKTGGTADAIDVAYVAHLARLQLSPDEIATFQRQLNSIVDYFKAIREVDVEAVDPMAHAVRVQNVFRADDVRPGLDRELALANAPVHLDDQFLVPKIVE
jgi:aspartyl-tRNA(Asn)/glutamyl-tRNA(Gln) amidotransferase subunit C